jgi:hypothetical protein
VPDLPSAVTAVATSDTTATIGWAVPFDGGSAITGIRVTCYLTVGAGRRLLDTPVLETTMDFPGAAITSTGPGGFTSLSSGFNYTCLAWAISDLGISQASAAAPVFRTWSVPDAPSPVNGTAFNSTAATITWGLPFNGGSAIIGFNVTCYYAGIGRRLAGGPVVEATLVFPGPTTVTTGPGGFNGLSAGLNYLCLAWATNIYGASAASAGSNIFSIV